MKIINTKSTAASLILIASVIPAFGQGHGRGSDGGAGRAARPQYEQRGNSQRGDSFRNRAVPQSPQRSQPQYQERSFDRAYRGDTRQYGGNAYRGDSGERYRYNSRGYGYGFGSGHFVIPQNRFYSSFGREHFFRIGRPVFYGRYPRFQYGGFWFSFVSAPPAYWGTGWYYNDDVYIDYSDGGYYLFDNRYPGQGIPLEVDNGDAYGAPPDNTYDQSYGDGYDGSYPPQY